MSKGKLAKFADMERFENVFQYPYSVVDNVPFEMKGKWREMYFHNDNPIVLELGCGKGEYTVELAKLYPEMNFIGVDIKGARMWTGAKKAIEEGQKNVAFLRTNIEIIDRFFAEDEVQDLAYLLRPADEEPPQAFDIHLLHESLSPLSRGWRHHSSEDGFQLPLHLYHLYGGWQSSAGALPYRRSLSSGGHRRGNSQDSLYPDLL